MTEESVLDSPIEASEAPQLSRSIYLLLKKHIEARAFPEGLVLGEANIAKALDVSRTPARGALEQLAAEGLVSEFGGRGMLVVYSGHEAAPIRQDLFDAGLKLSDSEKEAFGFSGAADRIYPKVEMAASSCMAFGRFLVNQTALASHYGTSRTVAHVVLARLERTGLVKQDRHARWYVERLTAEKAAEHYAIRQLLEPEALKLAFPLLKREVVAERWERLVNMIQSKQEVDFAEFDQIERDIHFDIIHLCPNAQMVKVIKESQLPLIATHYTFERYRGSPEISNSFLQHLSVLNHLMEGNVEAAAEALRYHLIRACAVTCPRIERLPPLSPDKYPPYLTLVEDPS